MGFGRQVEHGKGSARAYHCSPAMKNCNEKSEIPSAVLGSLSSSEAQDGRRCGLRKLNVKWKFETWEARSGVAETVLLSILSGGNG